MGNLPAFFVCGERMEHKDIVDAQRHEAKGASTAAAGQVLVANGDGTTSFEFLEDGAYEFVISNYSAAATQNPSAVDTPLQVEFGALTTSTHANIAADGTVTFNTTGKYLLTLFLRFGRTSGAGTAILLNRLLYNGVQFLRTNSVAMTDSAATIPFSATLLVEATAGDTLKVEIARDSAGINNGGLVRTTPTTLGWHASPSASIVVNKAKV